MISLCLAPFVFCSIIIMLQIIWPLSVEFVLNSIDPNASNPVHIGKGKAWTNWSVHANVSNSNIFPIISDRVKISILFKKYPQTIAAYCDLKDFEIGPGSKTD